MPTVYIAGSSCRRYLGGRTEIEVKADTFGRLIKELDARFPGLGAQVENGMAVAVDGEIYQDSYALPLRAGSEIVLIPKIGGG